jgi:hypothetical protein
LPNEVDPLEVVFACRARHVPPGRRGGVNGFGVTLENWRQEVARLRQAGRERAADMLAAAIREEAEAA